MKFKEWLKLQEVGTGTNAVAVFSRPVGIGMVKRQAPQEIVLGDDEKKKRKQEALDSE